MLTQLLPGHGRLFRLPSWMVLFLTGVASLTGTAVILHAAEPEAAEVVTFTAEDYAFGGPERIEAGWRTLRLVNRGREVHQVQVLGLPRGKTAADLIRAVGGPRPRLPAWVRRHGGVNSIAPGAEGVVVIDLPPGDYVLICGIPDAEGRPHIVHGMLRPLRVTASPSPPASAPPADVTVAATDFAYVLDGPLVSGPRVLRVRNDGAQAHELVLVRLVEGASTRDFLDAYRPGATANPAGTPIGGMVGIDPGREGYLRVDVQPGRYGILCFLAEPVSGEPHFVLGMWLDLEVKPESEARP